MAPPSLSVSPSTRLLQVIFAVFFNLLCGGVIFGFAALKPVLVRQGVYAELCTEQEKIDKPWICDAQDLRMNFIFTLSAVVTNTFALPVGTTLDYIGPKWTTLIGAVFFALGNFVFGLQIEGKYIDTYFAGFILLAIGGPLIFLPSFHLSNTFPAHSGMIISFVTGAFDVSSVPYVLYNWMDEKLGGIPIRTFFWSYTLIPILLAVEQLTIAPSRSYERSDFDASEPAVVQDESDDSPLLDDGEEGSLRPNAAELQKIDEQQGKDPVVGAMFGHTALRQLRSSWFLGITVFLCTYMTRINFFIQTVHSQMLFYLGDPVTANKLSTAFTVLLPLGGVVGLAPTGLLLDYGGTLATSVVILIGGVAFGVLGILPSASAQLISMCIFVIVRPLMYTFVGDYSAKIFGFQTFGTVYGLCNSLSGVFGLILRPIDVAVKGPLNGNYTIINFIMLCAGLLASAALSLRIARGGRRGSVRLE